MKEKGHQPTMVAARSAKKSGARSEKRTDAVEEARRLFSTAGLTLPPIPDRFTATLRTLEPWCFATRGIDPMAMYFFRKYLEEALTTRCRDYVAFCHAGHGINSYALTYQLLDGPLVVMVQAGWGGAYSTEESEARRVDRLFGRCSSLIAAAERAKVHGLAKRKGRLIVFESDMRGDFCWGWLERTLSATEVRSWIDAHITPRTTLRRLKDDGLPTNAARRWLETTFVGR